MEQQQPTTSTPPPWDVWPGDAHCGAEATPCQGDENAVEKGGFGELRSLLYPSPLLLSRLSLPYESSAYTRWPPYGYPPAPAAITQPQVARTWMACNAAAAPATDCRPGARLSRGLFPSGNVPERNSTDPNQPKPLVCVVLSPPWTQGKSSHPCLIAARTN